MGMAGILFGILFLSLFIGVPIAISLGVAASLTMMLTNNAQYLASIPTRMFTQLDSFTPVSYTHLTLPTTLGV